MKPLEKHRERDSATVRDAPESKGESTGFSRVHSSMRRGGPKSKQGHSYVLRTAKQHEDKWPKVRPQNDWAGRQDAIIRKGERRRFAFADDELYGHKGIFLLHGYQCAPQIVSKIARDLEDFLKCPIKYDQDSASVEIVSENSDTVHKALSVLRSRISSQSDTGSGQLLVVDDPSECVDAEDTILSMVDAISEDARPRAAGLNFAPNQANKPEKIPLVMSIDEHWQSETDNKRARRVIRNALALRIFLERALNRLVHRRGFVQMRVRFGALLYHRYQWPSNTQEQPAKIFLESLRHQRTDVSLYKLTPSCRLFERIGNATQFLSPWSSDIESIHDTKPFFVGRYLWSREKESEPHWMFEATTDTISGDCSQKPSITDRKWLQPFYPGSCREMDAFITQMNGGVSCGIQIVSEPDTGEKILYPKMLTADKVEMLPNEDFTDAARRGLLIFDPRPSNCHQFIQRAVWKFRLAADLRYIIELTRYDRYADWRNPPRLRCEPVETRWDATIYNEDWDCLFARNLRASHEDGVNWAPSVNTFFPKSADSKNSYDGFESFLELLRVLLNHINIEERDNLALSHLNLK